MSQFTEMVEAELGHDVYADSGRLGIDRTCAKSSG